MTTAVEPGSANGTMPAAPVADDGRVGAAEEDLARQLAEQARAEGLSLTGPGGLLSRLTKVVLESALEGEMDAHLGYRKHGRAGDGGGNSRNGHRDKTVLTEAGPVGISVPRDRDASFAPAIVAKRQRRLSGVDDRVISLVAKGLTTGEVQAHLAEIYGAQVSRETISTITDRVLDGLAEWQSRPLDPGRFTPCCSWMPSTSRSEMGRRPTGPSTWPWASPPMGSATSWACGPASTAMVRAPGTGCGCSPRSATAAPAMCSWWSATGSKASPTRLPKCGRRPSPRRHQST
jgi:putative transposase